MRALHFLTILRTGLTGLSILVLAATVPSTPAHAQTPAYTVTGGSRTGAGNNITVGFAFTVNPGFTQTVTALGVYDRNQDGLGESHAVGIFDSVGALIASGTVLSGTSAPLTNQFRYVSINPALLVAGSYNIGAFYTGGGPDEVLTEATGFTLNSALTFGGSSFFLGGTSVSNPNTPFGFGNPGFFGPNFLSVTAIVPPSTAAPEPGSLALLLPVAGVAGMVIRKRKLSK